MQKTLKKYFPVFLLPTVIAFCIKVILMKLFREQKQNIEHSGKNLFKMEKIRNMTYYYLKVFRDLEEI